MVPLEAEREDAALDEAFEDEPSDDEGMCSMRQAPLGVCSTCARRGWLTMSAAVGESGRESDVSV